MGYAPAGYAPNAYAPNAYGMGAPMGVAPRGSGKAKAALVLGIVGIFLCFTIVVPFLALLFGALGRKEIDRSQGAVTGRGKALAGLILGIIGLVLGALIITVGILNRDNTALDDVEVGMCVNVPTSTTVSHLKKKDCDSLHDGEVFSTPKIDEAKGTEWPGPAGFQSIVQRECGDDFLAYVGATQAEKLTVYFVAPDRKSWDDDNRLLICVARDPSGQIDHSLRSGS